MTPHRLLVGLFVAGLVVVQAAWILATPPFRGIDEFDHAFRAASLVEGQVKPYDGTVADGRGDYVRVPARLARDAGPVCESYDYTGPDNCRPVAQLDEGNVKIASAAARYHPAYYTLVGLLASPWDGASFVYAARIVSAVICLLFWGAAVTVASRHRRQMLFPLAVASTPVLVYSQSILAPNGVEMAAAVLVWVVLLTLDSPGNRRSEQLRIILAAIACIVLVSVRSLGPGWLLLIIATVLLLPGRRGRLDLLRREKKLTSGAGIVVGAATVASVAWIASARANSLTAEAIYQFDQPWLNALSKVPLWVFQSIAAFPTRGEPAPVIVYALILAAIAAALLLAPGASDRSWRLTLLCMTAAWLIPPYVLTGLTYENSGAFWQGRYSLPYSVGILIVLLAWPRVGAASRNQSAVLTWAVGAAYAVASAVSVGNVVRTELRESPLSGDDRWITAPEPMLWAMALIGTALLFAPAHLTSRSNQPLSRREHGPAVDVRSD